MPSPIETLLRVQDSPLPTQTFFEFLGSIAIAPIDCTGCSSNTGRKRVPLSSDFQMPPLAAPTKRVILPDGSFTPAIAEIRPLIVAEPMLRAPRPEMVAELNGASLAPRASVLTRIRPDNAEMIQRICYFEVGNLKIASSTVMFGSALSITIFCLSGAPLRPASVENGRKTPAIFS